MMEFYTQEMEKQVQARVQMILEDEILLKAFNLYGAGLFRRSSVFHGLAKFLREQNVRGDTCFEIGTWNGMTSAILSRHFRQVVTVDIVDQPVKHEIFEKLGITNVECFTVKNNEEKARLAKSLAFDFAYLDGDHAHDTESDFAMTKRCGSVLFHEAWPWQVPVWDLIHRLPYDQVTHGGAGLALWRKPE